MTAIVKPLLVPSFLLRHPARWLLWTALAIHVPIALIAASRSGQVHDFDRFYDLATRPGRPYVDFQVEYPPGAVLAFKTIRSATGNRAGFGIALVIISVVADVAIVAALGWGWGIAAAAGYALVVIPLIDLFFHRADLWSTALVAIGVAAWRRERRIATGLSLAAGAALKLWPLAFFGLLLVPARGRGRLEAIVVAAAAGTAMLAGWLWMAGRTGVYEVLTFREASGWEIESTVGSVWMLVDRSSMRIESDAWRIGATTGTISILFFALAALPSLWVIWRGGRTGHVGAGWIGGVSTVLVLSALFSPQFAAWLAPASGIAWAERDRRLAILSALAVFLTNLVWKAFNPLLHGVSNPLVTLLARNALLVVLVLDAARLVGRRLPSPPADERDVTSPLRCPYVTGI